MQPHLLRHTGFNDGPLVFGAELLLVGGGGAGGSAASSGGGGAGGQVLLATIAIDPTVTYPVQIGAGGVATEYASTDGGDSRFGGLTARGGPAGGRGANNGRDGPSGSGAGYLHTGGRGTPGEGFDGGDGGEGPFYPAGGGGGAGGPGVDGVGPVSGNGGPGVASSISGTLLEYGGGGGGSGSRQGASSGIGRSRGGAGGVDNGLSAEPNSGSGGGGAGNQDETTWVAGQGGSGIAIVRYPGVQRGTGGTVTSLGGYTIHTFTSDGAFVPYGTVVTLPVDFTPSLDFRDPRNSQYLALFEDI